MNRRMKTTVLRLNRICNLPGWGSGVPARDAARECVVGAEGNGVVPAAIIKEA